VADPCEGTGGQVERGVHWHARAKEEEEEEEEEEKEKKAEEEEEEILGKVLEWRDPVVRRGPLQRPVRIKDWEIDPVDLKWGTTFAVQRGQSGAERTW
jgi:hypothetical protein